MTEAAVIAYARSFLGTPYLWGGNNRLQGMDCGSFVSEVLRAFGLVGPHQDLNSDMLYERFFAYKTTAPKPGTLVFFGSERDVVHVGLMVDRLRMLEAGGGDRTVDSLQRAAAVGAMVRERPISFRKDFLAFCHPPYPSLT